MSDREEKTPGPEWRAYWNEPPAEKSSPGSVRIAYLLIAIVVTAAFSIGIALLIALSTAGSSGSVTTAAVAVAVGIVAASAGAAVPLINRRGSPTSLRIAILGLPQVGKTTLIASCFEEIFARRVNIRAVMSGGPAVQLLNENIANLAVGRPIRQTKDQQVAAYRFEIPPSTWFSSRYRVEIGDFPGEDTERYAKDHGPWLHNTPFFEWALTCDAFAFCVDVAPLTGKDGPDIFSEAASEYVGQISAAVRVAWQNIVASFDPERRTRVGRAPLLLAFTKVDLLFRPNDVTAAPSIIDLTDDQVKFAEGLLAERFQDLIEYLRGESTSFSFIVTSSFARTQSSRVGIAAFLRAVLPRQAFQAGSGRANARDA